jgi:polysaccharide biosynthesis/export protein
MNTKRNIFSCLALGLALVGVGCRSYGPKFDATAPTTPEDQAALLAQERQRVAPLDSNLFTSVELTNAFDPSWLKPPTDLYRLGPTDQLEIETLGDPESRSMALVGPDGKIYYSYLPGLFVWGLTLAEARQVIEKEMAKYLRVQPEIAITLRGVGSQRVWLLGAVNGAGVYTLRTPMTVLEAVSSAGGPVNDPALRGGVPNLDYSFLLRDGKPIRLDFARLLRNGDLSQNIYLQADDFLYLRPGMLRNIYVLGAVRTPVTFPYREQTTLSAVIAQAGGFMPYAQRFQVSVVRGSLSNPKIALVNMTDIIKGKTLDVILEPGDIVYVPFVPWQKVAMLAETIVSQWVRAIAINAGYSAVVPHASPIMPSIPTGAPMY